MVSTKDCQTWPSLCYFQKNFYCALADCVCFPLCVALAVCCANASNFLHVFIIEISELLVLFLRLQNKKHALLIRGFLI